MDRLVEKGLVDRVADPSDRRVVICQLSESGKQAIKRFWRIGRERLQIVVDLLDEEQLETVVQGFEYDALGRRRDSENDYFDANDFLAGISRRLTPIPYRPRPVDSTDWETEP